MSELERVIASCLSEYDPEALPVEAARRVIAGFLRPVTAFERIPVRGALGRVLATDLISTIDVPAHDNSAMDGYAVRSADLSPQAVTRLRQVGEAYAGRAFGGTLAKGECVRVMTGAVMPGGADTVIVQEVCRVEEGEVVIPAGQNPAENVRFAGEDLGRGRTGWPVTCRCRSRGRLRRASLRHRLSR